MSTDVVSDGQTIPRRRGRPKKLKDGDTMRGPSVAARDIYKRSAPQKFMDNIIESGLYRIVANEVTGQGVLVGQTKLRSVKTESGEDIALVIFEIFAAERSVCCNVEVAHKPDGNTECMGCGKPCAVKPEWVRKPEYIPNPKTGGRVKWFPQCKIQWSLIRGAINGMTELCGGAVEKKKEEVMSAREVVADKLLTSLKKYGL